MSAFVSSPDGQDPVEFALSYPFARPAGSFVFEPSRGSVAAATEIRLLDARRSLVDGLDVPVVSVAAAMRDREVVFSGRIPILASGSNAAPGQLERKYREHEALGPILAFEAEVEGLVSVYSAHVSGYGSIAATLMPAAAVSRLHVLLLPPEGLAHLSATESLGGNYLLAELVQTQISVGDEAIAPLTYLSRRGPARFSEQAFCLPGMCVSGAEVEGTQEEMQTRLHDLMGEASDIRSFVARLVADPEFRGAATAQMEARTRRIVPSGARILAGA